MDPVAVDDDFADATVQERFLMMMNDRVGNIEVAIRELRDMFADLRDYTLTDTIHGSFEVPKIAHTEIGAAFLDTLVDAMQKAHRVVVDKIWCCVYDHREFHLCCIHAVLKEPVALARASREMNLHVTNAFACFDAAKANHQEWRPTTLHNIHRAVRPGPDGRQPRILHR